MSRVALQIATTASWVLQAISEAQVHVSLALSPHLLQTTKTLEIALASLSVLPEVSQDDQDDFVDVCRSASWIGHQSSHKEEAEELVDAPSAWDPDSPLDMMEISRCRALLLEIVRRAAHDWVLYRHHERLELKQRAQTAYTWLFEEGPGHPWWRIRKEEGRMITAFLVICDELDLDPETVRARVRKMDIKSILSAGRPAERRHRGSSDDSSSVELSDYGVTVNFDVITANDNPSLSSYENHYAVPTPAYL